MSKLSLKKHVFALISGHWAKLLKMWIYKTAVPCRQRCLKNPGNYFFVFSICPHIKLRGGISNIFTFSYKDTPYCTALHYNILNLLFLLFISFYFISVHCIEVQCTFFYFFEKFKCILLTGRLQKKTFSTTISDPKGCFVRHALLITSF